MNIIDVNKLENVRQDSDGLTAACPLCRSNGSDRTGNHLKVFRSGKFSCIVAPSDKEHNAGILQLVGTESTGELVYTVPEPKIEMVKDWPINLLEKLIRDYSYFESRGISAATQIHFNIGVALSGQLNQRVVIPILSDNKNKIIGFTGRTLIKDAKPKWKHLSSKSLWKFVGDAKSIEHTKTIIIVEGPADILALYECGIKNTICLFGTTISSKQLGFLIKNNPKKIIIALNNEESGIGNAASEKLKKILLSYFSEEHITIGLPEGAKDFCELLETGRRNLIDSWHEKYLKNACSVKENML